MKKIYTLLFLMILSFTYAQTNVSGNQSGTWTQANSPYQVTGNITIPSGQTLTIEAGVTVDFQGYYKIVVDGKILANGTDGNIITFTTGNHSVGWGGVRLDGTNEISIFHYCKFEYGKTSSTGSYPSQHGGAVLIKDADAQFYNCVFSNNDATGANDGMGGAVYTMNSGSSSQTLTKFVDCSFDHNHAYGEGGAIRFTNDGNSELTRCTFINNNAGYGGGAIMFFTGYNVHLNNCLFYMNSANNSGGGAIKTLNPQSSLVFTNCTFAYNSAYGNATGGAIDLSYADVTVVNTIVYGNSQQYGVGINVGQGATAQIDYSDLDMPSSATGNNNLAYVNPQFVNIGQADFHLQSGSPCIDTGNDVGLPYVGSAPDMGCYEYGAVSIESFTDRFSVFPNPTTEFITIKPKENSLFNMRIYDVNGKLMMKKNEINTIETFLVSNLKSGIYLLVVDTKGNSYSQKIMIK